jgi:deoxyribodipyrimidine photolyase-related protein
MSIAGSKPLLVILGNQLFPLEHIDDVDVAGVFMAEDMGLCTYERHHQQKIVLFLAAMRHYADSLREKGFDVHYHELDPADGRPYEDKLRDTLAETGCGGIVHFEIEDKPMEERLVSFAKDNDLDRTEVRSPMFLCERDRFREYVGSKKSLRMADFYKHERQRLGILVDDDGEPDGGQWSFDADNRKKLPRSVEPPVLRRVERTSYVENLVPVVSKTFSDHPGDAGEFSWPVTRKAALQAVDDFLENRFADFGPYEDAMTTRSDTVFHSLLSPVLNLGLVTPEEVVKRALDAGRDRDVPMQSIEGFIRQVIGWREFVRGVYREFGERQAGSNFWSAERGMTDDWYEGTTGIVPLDHAIDTAIQRGWTHHIPRLMVLGNLMTLCEIRPPDAHRWFMEMYVDSSEWVMGPNVYGMGIFSDGGIFATKPYICGSNYLLKMSDYKRGDWCEVVDGLYWRFIGKHRDFFAGNARLALMPRALDRLDESRRDRIFSAAECFLEQVTTQ